MVDGRTDNGRTPDRWVYYISSPCEPNGSVELKIHINDDLRLTLTYFTAKSNLVAYAFELRKTVTKSFNGKNLQQINKLTKLTE